MNTLGSVTLLTGFEEVFDFEQLLDRLADAPSRFLEPTPGDLKEDIMWKPHIALRAVMTARLFSLRRRSNLRKLSDAASLAKRLNLKFSAEKLLGYAALRCARLMTAPALNLYTFFDVVPLGAPFMDRGKVPQCPGTGTKFIFLCRCIPTPNRHGVAGQSVADA